MDREALARRIATGIRDAVIPMLGSAGARRRRGTAIGGDPTFGVDEAAEDAVDEAFQDANDVAWFTEDRGLRTRGRPEALYLIDPIDGSRPAAAGFEACCVSVAIAPYQPDGREPTLGDVSYGLALELTTGDTFEAASAQGANLSGREVRAPTAGETDLGRLFWGSSFQGQPSMLLATVLRDVMDAGSEGAFFDHGCAVYSLTRLITGQLDAYVDAGALIVERIPGADAAFRRVGEGAVLNMTTYDCAAAALVLKEAGCRVTDAAGGSLNEVPLLDGEGRATQVSMVAASNERVHSALVAAVERGIERTRALVASAGELVLGP